MEDYRRAFNEKHKDAGKTWDFANDDLIEDFIRLKIEKDEGRRTKLSTLHERLSWKKVAAGAEAESSRRRGAAD